MDREKTESRGPTDESAPSAPGNPLGHALARVGPTAPPLAAASVSTASAGTCGPSRRELTLELFRRCPQIALELLSHLGVHVPKRGELHVLRTLAEPGESDDCVVLCLHAQRPLLGIVVDAQEGTDTDKRYAWPLQACALRARLRCPAVVCVVTPRRSVARWASIPTRIGPGNVFQPTVLGPAAIPAITDPVRAHALPELAVLSAMVHGRGLDQERAARIAATALETCARLELARCQQYTELVRSSLGEPARKLLHEMQLEERH